YSMLTLLTFSLADGERSFRHARPESRPRHRPPPGGLHPRCHLRGRVRPAAPRHRGQAPGAAGKIDMAYGTMAWLVIVVGILRVLLGGAGWEYYAGNWAFWLKMAAFFGVGLFSLPPTVALFRWRKAGTTPSATDVNTLR